MFFSSIETRGLPGEPSWLPSPAEVARARARMERLGVLASLRRHNGDALPEMPPGETPWLWWIGAILWLLAWPAAIAFWAAGHLPLLPWWLLPGLALLHMAGLAWPVWLAVRARSTGLVRRRFAQVQTLAQMMALDPDEFEVWTSLLFQLMGYQVRNTPDTGDHGIDLEVSGQELPLGLVQCKRHRGTIGEPVVRDLYGTMMGAHAGHGWLVTTGAFSRQAREWAAGKPLALWDGPALVALARKYR